MTDPEQKPGAKSDLYNEVAHVAALAGKPLHEMARDMALELSPEQRQTLEAAAGIVEDVEARRFSELQKEHPERQLMHVLSRILTALEQDGEKRDVFVMADVMNDVRVKLMTLREARDTMVRYNGTRPTAVEFEQSPYMPPRQIDLYFGNLSSKGQSILLHMLGAVGEGEGFGDVMRRAEEKGTAEIVREGGRGFTIRSSTDMPAYNLVVLFRQGRSMEPAQNIMMEFTPAFFEAIANEK